MLESRFQSELIQELKDLFPGCIVIKNDPNYLQGFPDLLILYYDQWAVLEAKATTRSAKRPNQQYYVDLCDEMSFAAFINADNKEDVLRDLQYAFRTPRKTRVSKR